MTATDWTIIIVAALVFLAFLAWTQHRLEMKRLDQRENEQLHRENAELRRELARQWGYCHSEYCDRVWPHSPGEECDWPRPSILASPPRTLSDDERLAVIEKARAALPALDKQVDESLEELRRLAAK